jgi:predicted DNA-binding transcriptional regulator YafY
MPRDLYRRYSWLIDTIKRRGRITRSELNERWKEASFNNGSPLERRTLFNYRRAIEELFGITIECDASTYEYYIAEDNQHEKSVNNWLLNSRAVTDAVSSARDISNRIFLEDVPSAREHLSVLIEAIKNNVRLRFDYHNYTRSRPNKGVIFEPYFLKIFKQRWYAVGRHVQENKVKTYALDRMINPTLQQEEYKMPADFDPDLYFRDAFGIVVTQNEPKSIAIRADHRNANYLRDLPLHHSQQEVVHDGFSIFYYHMRITDDLVAELLSYGSRLEIIAPPELKAMLVAEYTKALAHYTK